VSDQCWPSTLWTVPDSTCPALLASLLKDIKAERPKISEKDHLRLLYVTKCFLAFFHHLRSERSKSTSGMSRSVDPTPKHDHTTHLLGQWGFGLIAEVTERGWIVWVLKRMREAVEEKVRHSSVRAISDGWLRPSLAEGMDRATGWNRMSHTAAASH
jgi:hypothetical protein